MVWHPISEKLYLETSPQTKVLPVNRKCNAKWYHMGLRFDKTPRIMDNLIMSRNSNGCAAALSPLPLTANSKVIIIKVHQFIGRDCAEVGLAAVPAFCRAGILVQHSTVYFDIMPGQAADTIE